MYIDKLIRKEVITLLISVAFLVVVFIGVTFAKFLSVDKGQKTVINMGDLNISFCNNSTCDTTYSNIGQVIGTKVENGVTVPASIYPFPDDGTYSNETPYIFKIENTGSLDSTVKIKLKEDATYTPTGDYSSFTRLSLKYPEHLKVAIRKRVLYQDTGYQLGDVNMDGIVNYDDKNLLSRYLAKYQGVELSDFQKKLADLNFDSKVSSIDGALLARLVAGWKNIDGIELFHIYSYTDLEDGVIFKDDIIKAGESATYFLWLYLDESTPNDVQNTFFVGNIDVEGEFIPKVNPVSFSTDSWETIATAVKEGNISRYKVGDTKTVDLGTYGTHTLRIANTSTPSECSTSGFSQTACGFVLEFTDIITTYNMNTTATNVGGFPSSNMYTFINNDIYNSLPTELQNVIINTKTISGHGSGETTNFTSTNKLYLLTPKEVYTNFSNSYDTSKDLTRALDYYTAKGVTNGNCSEVIKKNGSTATAWWFRTAYSYSNNGFYYANASGDWYSGSATNAYGVSPAFRIG